jgi:hypothetical protein
MRISRCATLFPWREVRHQRGRESPVLKGRDGLTSPAGFSGGPALPEPGVSKGDRYPSSAEEITSHIDISNGVYCLLVASALCSNGGMKKG